MSTVTVLVNGREFTAYAEPLDLIKPFNNEVLSLLRDLREELRTIRSIAEMEAERGSCCKSNSFDRLSAVAPLHDEWDRVASRFGVLGEEVETPLSGMKNLVDVVVGANDPDPVDNDITFHGTSPVVADSTADDCATSPASTVQEGTDITSPVAGVAEACNCASAKTSNEKKNPGSGRG